MDRKEKKQMKERISDYLDLGNGRYKDDEVETLLDLTENREEYDGRSKTHRHSFTGWSSDGKYTRDEETTYTIRSDNDRVRIDEHYEYHDDDGQHGEYDRTYESGRDILNILREIFE